MNPHAFVEEAYVTDTDALDELVGPRDLERMFNRTRQTIYTWWKRGEFPPPDKVGRNGAPHEWRRSTLLRHLNSTASTPPSA